MSGVGSTEPPGSAGAGFAGAGAEISAEPVRVLLVEDNDVYRSTLELLLRASEGIRVVGGVSSGDEAGPACRDLEADVVLMDFRLPGLDGAQATSAVRALCPGTAVVCLTAEATAADRAAVRAAGAVALLEKGQPTEQLVAAIRSAAGGAAL